MGPQRTRDLALPSQVPVAELLAPLLDRGLVSAGIHDAPAAGGDPADATVDGAGADPDGNDQADAAHWALVTVAGQRLAGGQTLAEAGVADGDLLQLRDVTGEVIADPVEDVRDSTEDHVDGTGRRWRARTGKTYGAVVAAVAVVLAAFAPGSDSAVLLTGVLVCLTSIVVTWWSAPSQPLLANVALAAGMLWAWRTTHQLTAGLVDEGTLAGEVLRHAYGGWAALVLVLVTLVGTTRALPYLSGLGLLAAVGTPATVALLLGAGYPAVAVAAAVAVLFTIGMLPRLAMVIGGMSSLDGQVRAGGNADHAELAVVLRRVDAILVGALVAAAATGTVAALVLTWHGGRWPALAAAGVGLALLTRSRVFDQARHVAPLRVAGTLVLAAAAGDWLSRQPGLWPWLPAVAVVAALLYAGLAQVPRSTEANARAGRVLRFAEILLVAGLIAATAEIAGLVGRVGF